MQKVPMSGRVDWIHFHSWEDNWKKRNYKVNKYVFKSNKMTEAWNHQWEGRNPKNEKIWCNKWKGLKGKGECKEWSGQKTNEKTLKKYGRNNDGKKREEIKTWRWMGWKQKWEEIKWKGKRNAVLMGRAEKKGMKRKEEIEWLREGEWKERRVGKNERKKIWK